MGVFVDTAADASAEPVVTTTMFNAAEQAAWRVAVDRGLAITPTDLRRLVEAAAPHLRSFKPSPLRRDLVAALRDEARRLHATFGSDSVGASLHHLADRLEAK